jgi:nucleotide-binding universal stress UspA family protein
MKVLLAVDGSECALRAAEFLARLLAGRHAQVTVANVQPPIAYGEVLSAETRARVEQWQQERGRQAAAASVEALAAGKLACDLRVLTGEPGPAITGLAAELGCDLIVMGTHGLGAVAGMALGSVASKVIRLAGMPVTVVK